MSAETQKITIRLTPNAKQNKIIGWEEDLLGEKTLKVQVTAIPEKGKANKALITLLSKTWKIPKSDITIIRGETSRTKILKIPAGINIESNQ
tara:strand:- start:245 stop:520 length:276 start_codon:yes stop_codon:yes gene_type:complete